MSDTKDAEYYFKRHLEILQAMKRMCELDVGDEPVEGLWFVNGWLASKGYSLEVLPLALERDVDKLLAEHKTPMQFSLFLRHKNSERR